MQRSHVQLMDTQKMIELSIQIAKQSKTRRISRHKALEKAIENGVFSDTPESIEVILEIGYRKLLDKFFRKTYTDKYGNKINFLNLRFWNKETENWEHREMFRQHMLLSDYVIVIRERDRSLTKDHAARDEIYTEACELFGQDRIDEALNTPEE